MKAGSEWTLSIYSLSDLNRAYNMGLQAAIDILEAAERLSWHGRRQLIEPLKQSISQTEEDTPQA